MNILGVDLEFDFFDADKVDLYEAENKKVAERIKEPTPYEGKTTGQSFRIQCGIVDDFFNSVFGPGTAEKLFKGKANLREHMEAFAQVSDAAMATKDDISALTEKYSPNRAQRRADAKQNTRNFNRHNSAYNHGKH